MLRNPLTWLLLLIASTALAACCGSVACENQDNLDDALSFRFNTDTIANPAQSFRVAQLDSVYIRRLPLDTAQRADTVLLTGRPGFVTEVVINNAQPFPQRGTRKLDRYSYTIYLGQRRAPTTRFQVDSVRLEDRFEGDGCCSYNVNVRKELQLDGQVLDLTDPDKQDQQVYAPLNRRP